MDWMSNQKLQEMNIVTIQMQLNNGKKKPSPSICPNPNLQTRYQSKSLWCYVFFILYYGMESWSLELEFFEIWLYRRILRIPWMDTMTHETVREKMKNEKQHDYQMKAKIFWTHNNNKYRPLKCIPQGEVKESGGPGRRRYHGSGI